MDNKWVFNILHEFAAVWTPFVSFLGDNNIHAIVRAQYASKFKIRCSPVENYDLYSGQGYHVLVFFYMGLWNKHESLKLLTLALLILF